MFSFAKQRSCQGHSGSSIAALRRRQDEIQERLDTLLERLLDKTIPPEVYNAKYNELQNEKAVVLTELDAHERANDRFFQEIESFITFSRRMAKIFEHGSPDDKMAVLKIVASNVTLEDKKARLNLRPAFALLQKLPGGYRFG